MAGYLILALAVVLVVWTILHKIAMMHREAREIKHKAAHEASVAYRAERRRVAEDAVRGAQRRPEIVIQ
jgi:hypothetical protein